MPPDAGTHRFQRLPLLERERLVAAAHEIEACRRVMARAGETMIARLTRSDATPACWQHYPDGGDVYDPVSHAQYYFHSHAEPGVDGEAGHFHTFLRPAGMPSGLVPERRAPGAHLAPCHLVAISVDRTGAPLRLFTTNRWVTEEAWYPSAAVEAMLDSFAVDRPDPSWAVNRWLTALFRLYRDEMQLLLRARDEALRRWQAAHPDGDALEDRGLEVASTMRIDLDARLVEVARTTAG
ncbi:hypothetical protein EDC65_4377 [Stella humosa]|uniref:DUF6969 domain-containing protein n=1 Tax=Stella humosa TaxID=94 RepID=A0A3N1KZI0_9PROT|nr:hypothetical protein [Stella humosa]ROP83728.1 hypothetical protein EDC65_4377 [Stella humosa]